MGFSVVSLIEILYFISLRPYCAARNRRIKPAAAEATKSVWFTKDETPPPPPPAKLYRLKDSVWQISESAFGYLRRSIFSTGTYQVQNVQNEKRTQQFPYTE